MSLAPYVAKVLQKNKQELFYRANKLQNLRYQPLFSHCSIRGAFPVLPGLIEHYCCQLPTLKQQERAGLKHAWFKFQHLITFLHMQLNLGPCFLEGNQSSRAGNKTGWGDSQTQTCQTPPPPFIVFESARWLRETLAASVKGVPRWVLRRFIHS